MTLFIACILLYHYNMEWWWYAVATAIWLGHLLGWEQATIDAAKKFRSDNMHRAPPPLPPREMTVPPRRVPAAAEDDGAPRSK